MPVATRRQAAKLQQQQSSPAQTRTREKTESLSSTLVGGDSEASNDDQAQSPVLAQDAVAEQEEAADSSSDDSSSADDSDSDSSSTASSDEEDDEDPSAHLAALLTKAKAAARARAAEEKERALGRRGGVGDGLAGNEEVVHFGVESESEDEEDDDEEEGDGATPKASTSRSSSSKPPPSLPPSLSRPLSFSHSASFPTSRRAPAPAASTSGTSGGIALAQDLGGVLVRGGEEVRIVPAIGSKNKGKGKEVDAAGDRFGQLPLPKLSKKEIRAKLPPTAGPQWFNMPATPLTTELKRDLDALRLSNALDPKKFMRGGAKRERVGEFFQVGHIINPSTRATTLSDNSSIKKRSFIEDVLSSEQQLAYAKRKTKEVLAKGMSGRKRERQRAKGGGGGHGGGGGQGGGGKRRKV